MKFNYTETTGVTSRYASSTGTCRYNYRDMRFSDIGWLYRLAHDRGVRRWSFAERGPTRWEHFKWFVRSYLHGSEFIITAHAAGFDRGERAGRLSVVDLRPAKREDGSLVLRAEVGIAIAPEYRGQGIAVEILRTFAFHTSAVFFARIKPMNLASIRAFRAAGFADASSEECLELSKGQPTVVLRCRTL